MTFWNEFSLFFQQLFSSVELANLLVFLIAGIASGFACAALASYRVRKEYSGIIDEFVKLNQEVLENMRNANQTVRRVNELQKSFIDDQMK